MEGSGRRQWTARLLVESAVVVFSILLALAVDEWRQARATEERVQDSLESLRSELVENRRTLRQARGYHAELADTLFTLASAGREEPPEGVPSQGWLLSVELLSNAWEVATTSGTTADMSHGTAVALARAFDQQDSYLERRRALLPVVYEAAVTRETPSLRRLYPAMAGIVSDVADWERQVLEAYDSALEALDGTAGAGVAAETSSAEAGAEP